MVERIFISLGKKPRFLKIPLWLFGMAIKACNILAPQRRLSVEMARRMNQDLVYDNSAAARDLGFNPRGFFLSRTDLI
jgi:hypothetical protein